jgi:hypothetical protein
MPTPNIPTPSLSKDLIEQQTHPCTNEVQRKDLRVITVNVNPGAETISAKYGRGQNPSSLQNLQPGRVNRRYESPKKQRTVTVTEDGWAGIKSIAEAMDMSISEVIEQIGRGMLKVKQK